MPRAETPPEIRIPSLRKQRVQQRNLMVPGSGTPWEDRGQLGTFTAFARTCTMSMFNPVRLARLMRRPDTDHDTRWFAAGCGLVWGISLLIHQLLSIFLAGDDRGPINWNVTGFQLALPVLLAPLVVVMLVKLQTSLVNTLAATELHGQAPPVLTFNVLSYCLGGSVLAVVPYIGPPLAVLWISVVMIRVSTRRLYLRASSAVVGIVLSMLAVLVVAAGICFGGWLLWIFVVL